MFAPPHFHTSLKLIWSTSVHTIVMIPLIEIDAYWSVSKIHEYLNNIKYCYVWYVFWHVKRLEVCGVLWKLMHYGWRGSNKSESPYMSRVISIQLNPTTLNWFFWCYLHKQQIQNNHTQIKEYFVAFHLPNGWGYVDTPNPWPCEVMIYTIERLWECFCT